MGVGNSANGPTITWHGEYGNTGTAAVPPSYPYPENYSENEPTVAPFVSSDYDTLKLMKKYSEAKEWEEEQKNKPFFRYLVFLKNEETLEFEAQEFDPYSGADFSVFVKANGGKIFVKTKEILSIEQTAIVKEENGS